MSVNNDNDASYDLQDEGTDTHGDPSAPGGPSVESTDFGTSGEFFEVAFSGFSHGNHQQPRQQGDLSEIIG